MGDGQFKPGVAAIIIIAIGILIITLLFIFAKRQIMRMAQKFPTDGPHTPIGYDAPKKFQQKIEQKLNSISNIKYEPTLINSDNEFASESNSNKYKHIYRMKAMDLFKDFVEQQSSSSNNKSSCCRRRKPDENLKEWIQSQCRSNDNDNVADVDSDLLQNFLKIYYWARSDPEPIFDEKDLNKFQSLLDEIKSKIIIPTTTTTATTITSTTTTTNKRKILTKNLTTNLSFKNLTNLTGSSSSSNNPTGTVNNQNKNDPIDETCV